MSISTALRHLSTICLLTIASTPAVRAQEEDDAQPSYAPTVSMEFRGGTLADYVAAIRATSSEINVLTPPEVSKVRVPPLTLRKVGVKAALDAVTDIVEGSYDIAIRSRQSEPGTNPVFVVAMKERARPKPSVASSPERIVRVYSLRGLTDPLPSDPKGVGLTVRPETILTAVQTGLGIGANEGSPADEKQAAIDDSMKYHADSGLLFVHATIDRTNTVEAILNEMQKDLLQRRQSARIAAEAQPQTQTPAEPPQEKKTRSAEKSTR